MKKEEIEHLIMKYEIVRECAEERLNEYNLQFKQLTEAEKHKHGDYGIAHRGLRNEEPTPVLADAKYLDGRKSDGWLNEDGSWNCAADSQTGRGITNRGNIFKDLKALSEPLEEWESKDKTGGEWTEQVRLKVGSGQNKGKVWIGTNGHKCWYPILESEEIHRKLGQVIAFAKSKT